MTQQQTQIGSEAAGGETQMGGGENLDVNNFGLVPRRAGAERAPEALRKSDGGAVAGNGFAQSPQMAQSDPRPQLCQAFVTVKSIDALGDTFSARLAGPSIELHISGAVFTQVVAVGEVFRIDLHRLDEEAARLVTEQSPQMAQSEPEADAPLVDPLLQFFEFAHLPPHLAEISGSFAQLAHEICAVLPRNPERTVALRKLLEAKDCAVRARIYKFPPRTE